MDNLQKQFLDNWKKGKSLNDAIWQFCDEKYKQEYPQSNLLENSINTISSKNPLSDALNQLGKLSQYSLNKSAALEKLKKNLCEKLDQEHLIAIGYPESSNLPASIPLYLCVPKNMDLNNSSITGNGFKYVEVRIINSPNFNKKIRVAKQILPPDIPIGENKVGRQSLRNKIIDAYEFLKKHGRIDFEASLKEHTKLIQKTIQDMHGMAGVKGMKHEAIRRAVGESFKRDRASSKKAPNS